MCLRYSSDRTVADLHSMAVRQRIEELRDRLAEHTFGVEEPCEERPVKSAGLQPSERVRPRMRGAF